jgi:enterochelin esterase-like enzyme
MNLDVLPYSAYTGNNRRPRRTADIPSVGGVVLIILAGVCVGVLSLTACQRNTIGTSNPGTPAATANPTRPSPTISPTAPTPKVTVKASSTPLPCTQQSGKVIRSQVVNSSLPRPFIFRIYLPACYDEEIGRSFPSLYMLHGWTRDDSQWDSLGIDETADMLIAQGSAPPFIIIMPFHANGINLETALVDILVPYIDEQYRTILDPDFRSIGGLSRGGGRALRIGLQNPDLFHTIGLHSPANMYNRYYITLWADQLPADVKMHLWIDIGDQDSLLESTQILISWLDELGLDPLTSINTGGHDSDYWSQHLESYLTWYIGTWPSGK